MRQAYVGGPRRAPLASHKRKNPVLGFVHAHAATCIHGGSGGRAHSVTAPPPAPPVGTKRYPHKQQQLIRVPLAWARRRGPSRHLQSTKGGGRNEQCRPSSAGAPLSLQRRRRRLLLGVLGWGGRCADWFAVWCVCGFTGPGNRGRCCCYMSSFGSAPRLLLFLPPPLLLLHPVALLWKRTKPLQS